jgi:2-haloacid dehalogenase
MIDALPDREHTSYREIGHRSVAFVLERAGIPCTFAMRCATSLLTLSG